MKSTSCKTDNRGNPLEPLVSIVLPTYKRARKLKATIDSVFNQTYKNWELIVVDDNDYSDAHGQETRDVVKLYQHSHNVVFISHGINKGACAARNTGISSAKGEFVAFLDDDDTWSTNKLELQLNVFQSAPEVGFVFCDYICIDNADNTKQLIKPRFNKDGLFLDLLKRSAGICTSALVIKRDLLISIGGFDNSLPSYQDFDLLLRLSLCSKYASIDVPLLSYNVSSDGISKNYYSKFMGLKIILDKYREYFSDKNFAHYYGIQLGVLADYAVLHGKRWIAIKFYILSISKRPASVTSYVKLLITLVGGERLYRFISNQRQKARQSVGR